jgi:hypothetical protein
MAMDKFEKAIDRLLSMTPVGLAATGPKKLKNLIDKAKKEKGKPKGKSPSMILGSASKAGMQGKQGKRVRRPNPMTPRPTGRPPRKPLQNFLRPVKKAKGRKA